MMELNNGDILEQCKLPLCMSSSDLMGVMQYVLNSLVDELWAYQVDHIDSSKFEVVAASDYGRFITSEVSPQFNLALTYFSRLFSYLEYRGTHGILNGLLRSLLYTEVVVNGDIGTMRYENVVILIKLGLYAEPKDIRSFVAINEMLHDKKRKQ